jgi:LacI family transcriptional regulator
MDRPTQADVARLAGVSRATVSYVLNDQGSRIPISAETRQRVLDAIANLGYVPDARAQSLRSGDTQTIGVLLPDLNNPHFLETLSGISIEAETAGYNLLLSNSVLSSERERAGVKALAQGRVDGLILVMSFQRLSADLLTQVQRSGRPIVEISMNPTEFDCVYGDYVDATRSLMSHLLDLGHKRIGFVFGATNEELGYDRLLPYRHALGAAGLPADDRYVVRCGASLQDGYTATCDLLDRPDRPTAVIVINDVLAIGALRAAADLNLSVPADVSIASFDDVPYARFTIPRLTTVFANAKRGGQDAVKLLLRRLADPGRPHEAILAPTQLVIRESTGPAPS